MQTEIKQILCEADKFKGELIGFKLILSNLTQKELFFITSQWYDKYSDLHDQISCHFKSDIQIVMAKSFDENDNVVFNFHLYELKDPWSAELYVYMLLGMIVKLNKL